MNPHTFYQTTFKIALLSAAFHMTGLQAAAGAHPIIAFCPNAPITYIKQDTPDRPFTAELLKTLARSSDNKTGELIFTKMKMAGVSAYSGVFNPEDHSCPIILKPSAAKEMFYSLLLDHQAAE